MSLTVNIARIANHDTVCYEGEGEARQWKAITSFIAFTSIAVDLGEITDANADEFYCRAALIHALYGNARTASDLTIDDIRTHIGMTTNVVSLSRAKWLSKVSKHVVPNRLRDYQYRLDRERNDAAVVTA